MLISLLGTGHFKRNVATHITHIQKTGKGMYNKSTKAIRATFAKLWDTIPGEFAKGTHIVLTRIKEDFETLVENHSVEGDKETVQQSEIEAKTQLRQDFKVLYEALCAQWRYIPEPAQITIEDDVQEEEDVLINIEDLDKAVVPPQDDADDSDEF